MTLWDYLLIDPLSFALLCFCLACVVNRHAAWLLIASALFAVNKETALGAVAVIIVGIRLLVPTGGVAAPPLTVVEGAARHGSSAGGGGLASVAALAWTFVSTHASPRQLLAATAGTFNVLVPLAALQVVHRPRAWSRLSFSILLVAVLAQLLPASTGVEERLMVYAFPVVLAAAVFEVEYLAARFRVSRWAFWIPALGLEGWWWWAVASGSATNARIPIYTTAPFLGASALALEVIAVGMVIVALAVRLRPRPQASVG